MSVAITTNGTICNKEVFSILEKGRFNVILSIDGPADVHNEVRRTYLGMPTHARVMRFLKELRTQKGQYIRGSSVVRKGWSLRQVREYLNAHVHRPPAVTPNEIPDEFHISSGL